MIILIALRKYFIRKHFLRNFRAESFHIDYLNDFKYRNAFFKCIFFVLTFTKNDFKYIFIMFCFKEKKKHLTI